MGRWRPKCAIRRIANKNKKTIEDCQKLASLKNGKYLSIEYDLATSNYEWQC
jgi:hypothetical protein